MIGGHIVHGILAVLVFRKGYPFVIDPSVFLVFIIKRKPVCYGIVPVIAPPGFGLGGDQGIYGRFSAGDLEIEGLPVGSVLVQTV